MKPKTPDQIRRETVPHKHLGLCYGLLGLVVGAGLSFGDWLILHPEQVQRFPDYCAHAIHIATEKPAAAGLSAEQLRYSILRWGNRDHRFDGEILRHGWYPKAAASPVAWVRTLGAVEAVYGGNSVMGVLAWPIGISLLLCVVCSVAGLIADYRYRTAIIVGLQFDGSIVASVDDYNKEVKGDGMRYRVRAWSDR